MTDSIRHAVLLAAAFLAAACSSIEIPETNLEILFTPLVEPSTKAPVEGTSFPQSRSFDMSASVHNGETWFVGIPFSWSAAKGAWAAATPKYWPQRGSLDLFACSAESLVPTWGSNPANSATLSVTDNSAAARDVMFAGAGPVAGYSTVAMVFRHATANVSYQALATQGYDAVTNTGITVTGITLASAYWSGSLSATRSGDSVAYAWSGLASQKTLSILPVSVNLGTTLAPMGAVLLPPPQAAVGFTVYYIQHNGFDAGNNPVDLPLQYTYSASGTWAGATKYVYRLTFNMGQVTVNATVEPWEGSLNFVSPGPITILGTDLTTYSIPNNWS